MPPITRTQTGSIPQAPTKNSGESSASQPHQHEARREPLRRRRRDLKDVSHTPIPDPQSPYTEVSKLNEPRELPRFTIDLSLPPDQRYVEVCAALREEMRGLQGLFDEVVGGFVPWVPSGILRWVCWMLLWGLLSEENAELKGISQATGIDMYLLISFNVILDLLMGCSSGGAAVHDATSASGVGAKMVHFRTLDWGMPSLRRVLVHLDYVLEPHGEVVASSITYAGFVGVLTGVRKGLSISLNFRGVHDGSKGLLGDLRYYGHLGLVLFGFRPGVSSLLRGYLIPRVYGKYNVARLLSYDEVVRKMSCRDGPILSTACYLCFSSGYETTVIEKDLETARLSSNTKFIVVTNADADAEQDGNGTHTNDVPKPNDTSAIAGKTTSPVTALDELIEDANERKACAEQNYRKLLRRRSRLSRHGGKPNEDSRSTSKLPLVQDIAELVQTYPTTNECTHFAAVMDPLAGEIAWCRYWREPIEYR